MAKRSKRMREVEKLVDPTKVYKLEEAIDILKKSPERTTALLLHGILHLLGYDHETDNDYKRMRAKEAFILKKARIRLN